MNQTLLLILNSMLLGVGLAMDAFSVSLANGLHEPDMPRRRMCAIAGTFGGFQIAMPLIGWFCVRTVAQAFTAFQPLIPWIALVLLAFIGGKMLVEGIRNRENPEEGAPVGFWGLMLQGVATSIDALSVGFTMADLETAAAVAEACIIGVVTFGICIAGLILGRKVGTKLSGRASILGGVILIAIGLEIFLSHILA